MFMAVTASSTDADLIFIILHRTHLYWVFTVCNSRSQRTPASWEWSQVDPHVETSHSWEIQSSVMSHCKFSNHTLPVPLPCEEQQVWSGPENPSCWHTAWASFESHPLLQMVPHSPLWYTSGRPSTWWAWVSWSARRSRPSGRLPACNSQKSKLTWPLEPNPECWQECMSCAHLDARWSHSNTQALGRSHRCKGSCRAIVQRLQVPQCLAGMCKWANSLLPLRIRCTCQASVQATTLTWSSIGRSQSWTSGYS